VDQIKIDHRFVGSMLTDTKDALIVEAIIRLGRSLGIETVAEGVEGAGTVEQLRLLGCQIAQGFYYGHPMTGRDVFELASTNRHAVPAVALPTGDVVVPAGAGGLSTGKVAVPTGAAGLSSGAVAVPAGAGGLSTGDVVVPAGAGGLSTGKVAVPTGAAGLSTGAVAVPTGVVAVPTGAGGVSTGAVAVPTRAGGLPTGAVS
jgi:hypothetical protein